MGETFLQRARRLNNNSRIGSDIAQAEDVHGISVECRENAMSPRMYLVRFFEINVRLGTIPVSESTAL